MKLTHSEAASNKILNPDNLKICFIDIRRAKLTGHRSRG